MLSHQHLPRIFLFPLLLVLISGCKSTSEGVRLFSDDQIEQRKDYIGLISQARDIHSPNGIQEQYQLEIGGVQQWINVRGRDTSNPVLLVLHGGPGWPQLPLAWNYQSPWEDFFIIVNWEQRGAGKNAASSNHDDLETTMTFERLVKDAEELAIHLQGKFNKEKIVLMGYSYGTRIGLELVKRRPDLFNAYVAIGQVTSDGEQYLYEEVLSRAEKTNDLEALGEIKKLAPYPDPDPVIQKAKSHRIREYTAKFNGNWYGRNDINLFYELALLSPDYSDEDLISSINGNIWFGSALVSNSGDKNKSVLETDGTVSLDLPVIFLSGRHDLMTPYQASLDLFSRIQAPSKEFVTFEHSAHFIMFSQPGDLLKSLIDEVLPHAKDAQSNSILELFEDQVEAFNERDVERLAKNVSMDFKWYYLGSDTLMLEVEGRENFRSAMEGYFGAFSWVETSILNYAVIGDRISFEEEVSYRTQSGEIAKSSSMGIYEIKDGVITQTWYFLD